MNMRPTTRRPSNWRRARANRYHRVVDALPDIPDTRDYIYQPSLSSVARKIQPWVDHQPWWSFERIRDQGNNPSCTGHALAALVDHLRARDLSVSKNGDGKPPLDTPWSSARMLYETARYHDEWLGEDYGGSSCRGALKGFFYNGVCSLDIEKRMLKTSLSTRVHQTTETDEEYPWFVTRELLESARLIQLGAYYRIRPRLADFHAAINEAGVILVSASIHDGWYSPDERNRIPFHHGNFERSGRHAFLVVGYDGEGFWVQNSWGQSWGECGLAHWRYDDWSHNVDDAWVASLAAIFSSDEQRSRRIPRAQTRLIHRMETDFNKWSNSTPEPPSRLNMIGHLVPVRAGQIDELGHYNHELRTLEETFNLINLRYGEIGEQETGREVSEGKGIERSERFRYRHVVVHFLGGHVDDKEIATEVDTLIPIYKENGIYPLFFLWEAELANEMANLVKRIIGNVVQNTGKNLLDRSVVRDRLIEGQLCAVGSRIAREYLRSARRTFAVLEPDSRGDTYTTHKGGGVHLIELMFEILSRRHRNYGLSYHVIAHDVGALLASAFFEHQRHFTRKPVISTVNLISPALSLHKFDRHIMRYLARRDEGRVFRGATLRQPEIEKLNLFVLDQDATAEDKFSTDYGNSWPFLWSSVLGLEEYRDDVNSPNLYMAEGATGALDRPLFKLLWLPEIAQRAADMLASRQCNAEVHFMENNRSKGRAWKHKALDLDPDILNQILRDVLGRQPTTPFRSD